MLLNVHQSPGRRSPSKGRSRRGRVLLEALEARTLLASGPRITGVSPTEVRNATFDHIDVTFDKPINETSFTVDDVTIAGLGGSVAAIGVALVSGNTYRVSFPALTVRGPYQLAVGPNIADTSGNLMNQDGDGTNGELVDDAYHKSFVYISADVILTAPITISEANTSYDGHDLLIDGATVAIDGPHNFHSVHLVNGGSLTHSSSSTTQTHGLLLTVMEQVIIDASSAIDVTGRGYASGYTSGNTTVGGAVGYAGGSYGGRGGPTSNLAPVNATNLAYGDYADPDDWGSGGGGASRGGGLVRLHAAALQLDGVVRADGGSAGSSGGGSGGGVLVDVGVLSGAGRISAAGGAGQGPSPYSGSGGGGGRVAVYARDAAAFNLAQIVAPGGGGHTGGGAGTVFLRDTDDPRGTLVIDAQGLTGAGTPLGLPGQATASFQDAVVVRGSRTAAAPEHPGMALEFAAALTVEGGASLSASDAMQITATGSLLVRSAGALSVSGPLVAQTPVTVSGGTLTAGRFQAPALSVAGGGVVTSFYLGKLELDVAGTLAVDASTRST
ncbi:MAG: hypothetical protein U0800_08130 [Isosphaeraceae bacterium]